MPIAVSQTRVWTQQDTAYACARVGFVARSNPQDLAAKAAAAGFANNGGNEYVHSDGSWVRMEADGNVNRGVGGVMFQGIPGGRAAQPAPQPAATYQGGGVAVDPSRPGAPASMVGYKLAQIGIVDARTAPGVCAQHGFTQSSPGMLVHPDGSWVAVSGNGCRLGWKGHNLNELPFSGGAWR